MELAGMIDEQGRIGRSVETWGILRPDYTRMKLNGQQTALIYDTRAPQFSDIQKPELLDRFVRLENGTADQILAFAKSYGVLSLRAIREQGVYAEDLDFWRDFAARARATLDLAACIHRGKATRSEDWERLRPWWLEDWRRLVEERQAERNQLADVLNTWLRLSEVRPCFEWAGMSSKIVFTNVEDVLDGEVTMLGALALQIVLAVNRARFIATCSGCGVIYPRRRQAPIGRANYCKKCGLRAAWRDAQARRRAGTTRARKSAEARRR